MNTFGWALTKCDDTPDGPRSLVGSMSATWRGAIPPLPGMEWMLVHVRCSSEHVAFMRQDEDFIWIGSEWSKVPQQVLDAYAPMLDPAETYQNLGQVLDKLAEQEGRFLLRAA